MTSRHACRAALAAMLLLPIAAAAADRLFVYNQTTSTEFTGVYLAPAGTEEWGRNQALNDRDGSLETSERLPITGLSRGRFDLRLVDRKGRSCVVPGIDFTRDMSFEIRDSDLAGCH